MCGAMTHKTLEFLQTRDQFGSLSYTSIILWFIFLWRKTTGEGFSC